MNIQTKDLGEIRRSVGQNLGIVIVGAATSTTDTASIIDTNNLFGADDEHNYKQVRIYETTDGNAPEGENRIVTDYDSATQDATTSAFTAAVTALDKYEMWERPYTVTEINEIINQVLMDRTQDCPQIKEDKTLFTESNKYLYGIPSGFVSLANVAYEYETEIYEDIDNCESAWTAGTNATVTVEDEIQREGSGCEKIVIADAASTNEVIAYGTISALDISNCSHLEFSIYTTKALSAGEEEFHLDDTAALASGIETLDIPATAAYTWKRHSVALATPTSDTAIISYGLYQVTDVGACTIYIDKVRAVDTASRVFHSLHKNIDWWIARGDTNYIQLSESALAKIGPNRQLRLQGYQNLTLLDEDSDECEIDPGWVINRATAEILRNHAKPLRIDIKSRMERASMMWADTEKTLPRIITKLMTGTEII